MRSKQTKTALLSIVLLFGAVQSLAIFGQMESGSNGSEISRVEFRDHMNLILVEASINNSKPLTLLVDSGSSTSLVLDNSIAEKLGLELGQPMRVGKTSQGTALTASFSPSVNLRIGGYSQKLKNVLVAPCQGHAKTMLGIKVQGILGHPFLKNVALEVDYVKHKLILHDPDQYRYQGNGAVLDLEFNPQLGNLPFTTVSFQSKNGQEHKTKVLVDSGGSVMVTGGLGLKEDIEAIVSPDSPRIPTLGVTGLGSSVEETLHSSYITKTGEMKVGPFSISNPTLSCGKTHKFNLIGAEVLHRFDVVFDYKRNRMIVTPNDLFDLPIRSDASGLMLVASDHDLSIRRVLFVTPGSAGDEAGFKAGDILKKINGLPASNTSLHDTRRIFFQPNQKHTIEVTRGSDTLSLDLLTKKMF